MTDRNRPPRSVWVAAWLFVLFAVLLGHYDAAAGGAGGLVVLWWRISQRTQEDGMGRTTTNGPKDVE